MNERAEYLLEMPVDVLFAHGGCHIFAQVLHQRTGYPLVSIRNDSGEHNHVACVPQKGFILDVYGWWSNCSYIEEVGTDLGICFYPIQSDKLETQFIYTAGTGFYAHPDFVVPATALATQWIARYSDYFDGLKKCPIPGYTRKKSRSKGGLAAIFAG
jgi:hypothetical protein